MKGKLYLVATPIGNLEDITLRAIRILKEVDIIAAEDTRHTLKLLNHLNISKPLISYHRHNEEVKCDSLINKLLEGENIALVSDAGTPVISDPGEEIVKEAINNEIEVVPIPGACALVNALIASGLDSREFSFYGFLSLNKKIRMEKLKQIMTERKTSILYEAPHKIQNTLKDILNEVGDRNIVLARELTKIHEEYIRGKVSELIEKIENFKGEFIILIEGNNNILEEDFFKGWSLEQHYKFYENQGLDKKEIIKKIAKDRKVVKNEIYNYFITYNKKNEA
ncbi:MAG: 16S rRNA (cytidine(1402)-2'-O)-methyltransferase [Clostridia bacterium]|nr:16S rRNA (cytidine(1402)-2'-O)-methyltransferase [Clostridia bacterium]